MSPGTLELALFSVGIALAATVLLAPPCIGAGWLLARYSGPGKGLIETVLALPLVLPPTAVGLLLLELLSRDSAVGGFLSRLGIDVLFTPRAVVLAAMVMAFPLWTRAARAAFEAMDERLFGMARSLGKSAAAAFFQVVIPLSWRGLLAGGVLAFSRALGEFGATILIAGNIPGRTQTLSLAIFQHVQRGDDAAATELSLVTLGLAFASLWMVEWLGKGRAARLAR